MHQARPKVFFIGFNKTGTTSFHRFFKDNKYNSFHYSDRFNKKKKILGRSIKENLEHNRLLLTGIDDQDVYSDFYYSTEDIYFEASTFFKLLDEQYPKSYFILQTRNEDDWIKSRFNHKSKDAKYLYLRAQSALGLDKDELEVYWRTLRRKFEKEVKNYFCNYNQFLTFDLDNDDIEAIIEFLKDDYCLDKRFWKKHNVTQ